MYVNGSYQIESVFVKKGMKGFFVGSTATNSYSIKYLPLVN